MDNKLSQKIIEEIKEHNIKPKPKWQFLLKHWVLWLAVFLSVSLGSIAIAIIVFLFFDHDTTAQVYLKQGAIEDILLTVPYFWLITLVVLIGICRYAVAHTKFGYRHATIKIVGVVLMLSVLFGVALNSFDVGEWVQNFLIETVPYYDNVTYTSKDEWSHPEKGLLGGTITAIVIQKEFTLLDFRKKYWSIDISNLDTDNINVINQGATIKIIGLQKSNGTFSAEQVFSWDK